MHVQGHSIGLRTELHFNRARICQDLLINILLKLDKIALSTQIISYCHRLLESSIHFISSRQKL